MQCKNKYHKAGVQLRDQIIGKFNACKDGQEKFQLLLLATKPWGRRKLMKVFDTSDRKPIIVKKIVSEHGILTFTNPKSGRALNLKTMMRMSS